MSKTFADKLTQTNRKYRQLKRGRFSNRQITKEELEDLPSNEKIYNRAKKHRYFPINFRFIYNFLQSNVNNDWDTVYSHICKNITNKHQRKSFDYFGLKDDIGYVTEDGRLLGCGKFYHPSFIVSSDGKLTSVKDWTLDPKEYQYKVEPLSLQTSTPTSRIYKRPVQQRIELVKAELYLIQYKSVWYLANPGDLLKESLRARLHTWLYDQCDLRDNDWIAYRVVKQLNKKDLKKYREKGLIT